MNRQSTFSEKRINALIQELRVRMVVIITSSENPYCRYLHPAYPTHLLTPMDFAHFLAFNDIFR